MGRNGFVGQDVFFGKKSKLVRNFSMGKNGSVDQDFFYPGEHSCFSIGFTSINSISKVCWKEKCILNKLKPN